MSDAHVKDFLHPLRFDGAMTRPFWFWRPRIARFANRTVRGASVPSKAGTGNFSGETRKVASPLRANCPRGLAVDEPHAGQHQSDASHFREPDPLAEQERRQDQRGDRNQVDEDTPARRPDALHAVEPGLLAERGCEHDQVPHHQPVGKRHGTEPHREGFLIHPQQQDLRENRERERRPVHRERRTMERFSPLTVNWTTLSFSILPQILLLGMNQKALTVGLGTVPLADWLVIGYLIVFATALGQQAWLYGVQGIGPSRAGVFVNLVPVSALILSALLLGEQIGLTEVAGIAMVLAGVWLVNHQSARFSAS